MKRDTGPSEMKQVLFKEVEDSKSLASGSGGTRAAAKLVPRDVTSAREFLREVLGSVTVYPVKHLATHQPVGGLYALDDRVRINWPREPAVTVTVNVRACDLAES